MTEDHVKEKIFIFGASGHAKVVIDIVEQQNLYVIAFLVDDNLALKDQTFYGYSVLGGKDELLALEERPKGAIVAVGDCSVRCKIAEWLCQQGYELVSAVHPSAQLARGAFVGDGTVVMSNAVINSDTLVGNNVIINTGATIDHDCIIGDGVHIAPGSTLCGAVRVGSSSFIGAGATIIPNISIGENVMVGAGATVVRDVPDGVTVVGCPAK